MQNGSFYNATIESWDLNFVGQDEKPCAEITFLVQAEEGPTSIRYRGWLTERAKARTINDLVTLGFSDTDLTRFSEGDSGNALDRSQNYRVKVACDQFKGKTYWNVVGIYPAHFPSARLSQAEKREAAKRVDIFAAVLAAKADRGEASSPLHAGVENDIPF